MSKDEYLIVLRRKYSHTKNVLCHAKKSPGKRFVLNNKSGVAAGFFKPYILKAPNQSEANLKAYKFVKELKYFSYEYHIIEKDDL